MRLLILSDLHANLEALQAVLADAEGAYERIACCGDLVGYNPDPGAVVDWASQHCLAVVRGNHDKAIAGQEDLDSFNPIAKMSALWTQRQLSSTQLAYLHSLAPGPVFQDGVEFVHGSPRDEDEYVWQMEEAAASLQTLRDPVAFFGHTHIQGGFFERYRRYGAVAKINRGHSEFTLQLDQDSRYFINPGSVGQPRDGDPRAAYAIYDEDAKTVQFRRVAYDIETTALKLRAAGLPDVLWLRLYSGE